jgi:hypothetical protein
VGKNFFAGTFHVEHRKECPRNCAGRACVGAEGSPTLATWASLGWYIVIFEIAGRAYEHLLNDTGLQAFLDRRYGFHVLIGAIAARKCVCMTITGRGHTGGFENVF